MVQTKTLIHDFQLNEFLYDVIYHSTDKEKAKLTQRQLRAIETEKRAKNFITRATLDEKLIMLEKMGVQYSVWIHKVKTLYPAQVKKLYKKHKAELSEETISDLLESGLYIVTDRQVASFANLLGNGCHSENYLLNRDFYKIGDHIDEWEDTPHPTNENVREGMQHLKRINKLMLYTSMAIKNAKGFTQIGDLDFHILMYLFNKVDMYVPRETLNQYFRANYRMTVISAALKRMVLSAHVEKNPKNNSSYMISSLGINTVLGLMTKIVNDTLNY